MLPDHELKSYIKINKYILRHSLPFSVYVLIIYLAILGIMYAIPSNFIGYTPIISFILISITLFSFFRFLAHVHIETYTKFIQYKIEHIKEFQEGSKMPNFLINLIDVFSMSVLLIPMFLHSFFHEYSFGDAFTGFHKFAVLNALLGVTFYLLTKDANVFKKINKKLQEEREHEQQKA